MCTRTSLPQRRARRGNPSASERVVCSCGGERGREEKRVSKCWLDRTMWTLRKRGRAGGTGIGGWIERGLCLGRVG